MDIRPLEKAEHTYAASEFEAAEMADCSPCATSSVVLLVCLSVWAQSSDRELLVRVVCQWMKERERPWGKFECRGNQPTLRRFGYEGYTYVTNV